jgi:ribosomal protein S18 acetylase RimI-like enzyme
VIYESELRPTRRAPVALATAHSDDLEAVDSLVERVYRTPGLAPIVRTDLRTARRRTRDGLVLVAVTPNGEIVGTVTLAPARHPSGPCADQSCADLRLLAVDPAVRRQGVGEALVRASLAIAATNGFRQVTLRTRPSMGDALRLYQRLGFVRAAELDEPDPPACPALGFARPLVPPPAG